MTGWVTGTNSSKVALGETKELFLNRPGWFGRKKADYFLSIWFPEGCSAWTHLTTVLLNSEPKLQPLRLTFTASRNSPQGGTGELQSEYQDPEMQKLERLISPSRPHTTVTSLSQHIPPFSRN